MLKKNQKTKIKQMLKDKAVDFDELYKFLRNEDIGYWDNVNDEEIIKQYISEKMKEGVRVGHIVQAIEDNKSQHELYAIWLGNSMETPSPINNKKDLVEALQLESDLK